MTKNPQIAIYKGHRYLVIWSGVTKKGDNKTHLQFMNDTRNFWVDTDKIGIDTHYYDEPYNSKEKEENS